MSKYTFDTAAVIGTGMMGPGIALTLALGGLKATILSRSDQNASAALRKAHSQIELLRGHGLVPDDTAARAASLVSSSADFDGVIAQADLVVESAPENMAFKQDLFARMDAIAKPAAILASNTSGLSITAIASRRSASHE